MNKVKLLYLFLLVSLMACLQQPQRRLAGGITPISETQEETEVPTTTTENNFSPIVEITQFLDPIDGRFVKKLSLPKNYSGNFYIAGLNLGTLQNQIITVRFTFGREKIVREFNAVVGQSSQGVTSGVAIDLLTIDMNDQPFRNIFLPYDLYDYNDYSFDGASGGIDEPVEDNRNSRLFCRGLNIEDDPSFNGVNSCSAPGNECLYSFAKLRDNTLSQQIAGFFPPLVPSEQSINQTGITGFYNQPVGTISRMCAPSNGSPFVLDNSNSIPVNSGNGTFFYSGPYSESDESNWQILGPARIGSRGIYLNSTGVESLIFPRFVRNATQNGVEYLGSNTVRGLKVPQTNSGQWMEGCQARVASFNEFSLDHTGSCTVSATIEVLAQGLEDTEPRLIASSNDLKLQLLPVATINTEGSDILSNSFARCDSNSACGSDECCFNNRCWSQTIVSQCIDDSQNTGNQPVGTTCNSDLQCSSLCCNQSTGRCGVHDETSNPPVLCQKQPGQQCITRQFCQQSTFLRCEVVRTGSGQFDCINRCENVQIQGDCINGTCSQASPPINPPFNPSDPNRCQNAVDP